MPKKFSHPVVGGASSRGVKLPDAVYAAELAVRAEGLELRVGKASSLAVLLGGVMELAED